MHMNGLVFLQSSSMVLLRVVKACPNFDFSPIFALLFFLCASTEEKVHVLTLQSLINQIANRL